MVKQAKDWKWSSYQAMTADCIAPDGLSDEFLLSQFSKQRKTAIRKYKEFVKEGIKRGSIWNKLTHQIYLGDVEFVDKVQHYLNEEDQSINIPKVQKRPVLQPLSYYKEKDQDRNKATIAAYKSEGYSYQEIGEYFSTVGRDIHESKS